MSETAAPKKKAVYKRVNKVAEAAVDGMEPVVNTINTICAGVEAAANVAVPFANFLPLIGEIKADIEDLSEYLQVIGGGLTDTNKNVSDLVVQLSVLNKTIMDKTETNIFQNELLPYNDFDETEVDENIE
ncbi:18658_t:CDS:2 [Rhizophagus irregularis]|nr:18658_t:CDS:2 [Rhizophagus irregularis]